MLFLFTVVDDSSPTAAQSEEKLEAALVRLSAGDEQALEEIYKLTRASVYGLALSILKNRYDAEDAMQDCYVSVFQHASSYRSEGKALAWILTIARNLSFKRLSARSRISPEEEDFERYIENDAPQFNVNEQRMILGEVLRILSDEERQIVILHAVSGLKHKQIAQLLELPLSTVLSKYNRALKKLKAQLQEGEQI